MSACAITRAQCAALPLLARRDSFRRRESRRSRRPHPRRCRCSPESRRPDTPLRRSRTQEFRDRALDLRHPRQMADFVLRHRSGHRLTSVNPGAALTPSSARNSSRTAATISASLSRIMSRLISPPTNARARIELRRASFELEAGKAPRDYSPTSIAGTTKPNARGGPSKSASRNVRLTVADDA